MRFLLRQRPLPHCFPLLPPCIPPFSRTLSTRYRQQNGEYSSFQPPFLISPCPRRCRSLKLHFLWLNFVYSPYIANRPCQSLLTPLTGCRKWETRRIPPRWSERLLCNSFPKLRLFRSHALPICAAFPGRHLTLLTTASVWQDIDPEHARSFSRGRTY